MSKTLADFIQEARARIQEIRTQALDELLAQGRDLLLVDVREPYEYENGHIPGALLIPRGLLEGAADPHNKHRVATLYRARERLVVLYCDTGARSALAALTLQEMGFQEVRSLAGGINVWEAEELPVASDKVLD